MRLTLKLGMILLLLSVTVACDRFIPANQKLMKDAVKASDQAVRSEEKTWAMVLRIEELSSRLEKAVKQAEAAADQAEKAAEEARLVATTSTDKANAAATQVEEKARLATEAARQAEEAVRRVEAQEGESLQKMLEFMRELGYKP
jgi:outer membrane protein TolC